MTPAKPWPPITDLLPHRPPMLLVDALLDADAESLRASAQVRPGEWYSDDAGRMPAWVAIELMAQAIAAFAGAAARARGEPPKVGLLLGSRDYRATEPWFLPGEILEIEVRSLYREDNGVGAFACTVRRAGRPVVTATLTVFEPRDTAWTMDAQSGTENGSDL